jgi:serine phosphatase RsbU (regulator of sigma subunit)
MSYDFPEEEYSAAHVSIESGDRIVLSTDGIVEATDTLDEQYGTVRFKKILDSDCDLAADKFAEALLEDVSRWSTGPTGRTQQDDITLLTIDFKRAI